jgi:hypothetical protein
MLANIDTIASSVGSRLRIFLSTWGSPNAARGAHIQAKYETPKKELINSGVALRHAGFIAFGVSGGPQKKPRIPESIKGD